MQKIVLRVPYGSAEPRQLQQTINAALAEARLSPNAQQVTLSQPEGGIDLTAANCGPEAIDLTSDEQVQVFEAVRNMRVEVHEPEAGLTQEGVSLVLEFLVAVGGQVAAELVLDLVKSRWRQRVRRRIVEEHGADAIGAEYEEWLPPEVASCPEPDRRGAAESDL